MSAELNAIIREVAEEHPDDDPREIAEKVAKLTPPDKVMDFYTEGLVQQVLVILGQDRRNAFHKPVTGKGRNTSSKLHDRREWWPELCAQRVHIGNSEWKQLGGCTVDDLQFCINERAQLIVANQNQMNNFKHLQKLLVKHGAQTVSDLPPQADWPTK